MEKNIFIFDKNKCVGCEACVVACVNENGFQSPETWRNVWNSNSHKHPDLSLFYLSMACNHCDDAPCLKQCPTLAFSRDPDTGIVIHDESLCIGCNYCSWVCPYDAPKYDKKKGVIEKCNFCQQRIETGEKPACALCCPTGALEFDKQEFSPQEAYLSSPVPAKTGSSLKIIELRKNAPPKTNLKNNSGQGKIFIGNEKPISSKTEWPLIIFTFLSALMVGIIMGENPFFSTEFTSIFILISGVTAASFSFFHLGKKVRAWRSILNVRNSWISREILFFGFFWITSLTDFFIFALPKIVIVLNGLILLLTIDLLYRPVQWKWKIKLHSGNVLLMGISYWLILNNYFHFLIIFSVFRFIISSLRIRFSTTNRSKITAYILRYTLMIIAISLYITLENKALGILLFTISEFIERINFYNELEPKRPLLAR